MGELRGQLQYFLQVEKYSKSGLMYSIHPGVQRNSLPLLLAPWIISLRFFLKLCQELHSQTISVCQLSIQYNGAGKRLK